MPIIFKECKLCAKKPGMAELCSICLDERDLVSIIQKEGYRFFLDHYRAYRHHVGKNDITVNLKEIIDFLKR